MPMKPIYDSTHPVAVAVLPVRADAMEKARQFARDSISRMTSDLTKGDFNLDVVAPSATTHGPNACYSREAYKAANAKRVRFSRVTKSDIERMKHFYGRMGDPHFVVIDADRCAKFIEDCAEGAALAYDMFICKLTAKVGAGVKTATLDGNHVWDKSYLTVAMTNGTTQVWMTQTIINYSVLGTVFNQYPTRLKK